VKRHLRSIVVALAVALVLVAGSSAAQTGQATVRVVRPQSTVWNAGFTTIAAVVPAGTELTVVGRQGTWYRVVLPFPEGTRETGFIAISQVELVSGTLPAPATRGAPQAAAGQPPANAGRSAIASIAGFRGFGQVGYGWMTAHDSFKAMFGSPGWVWYGGGGQFVFRSGLFVEGSADFYRRSGTRVFVVDDEVFDLGIRNTITMLPVAGTVGYRFSGNTATPYVGGGAGLHLYREEFEFATSGEDIDRHFASYHALGGVEVRLSPRLASAIEVQYTHVPNDFTGLADVFDEHNLGGLQVRGKLLFGGR
jgi:opacity protein-like surface antigen